jgi:hypothetical protein
VLSVIVYPSLAEPSTAGADHPAGLGMALKIPQARVQLTV